MTDITPYRPEVGIAAATFTGYVACIAAANWLTTTYGLIPIGFGLAVTAGTFAAGAVLILRDGIQQTGGRIAVAAAITAGIALSYLLADPRIATASAVAFGASELVDWAIYQPLHTRNLPAAVLTSSIVAAPVDTALFLLIAGFPLTWPALLGQFLVKTGMAAIVAGLIQWRRRT